MTRSRRTAIVILLTAYALLFAALAIDIMLRVWSWRSRFDNAADPMLLLYFEGVRALFTAVGAALAIAALKNARETLSRSLPFLIIFATIACSKFMAFDAFPGAIQERVAGALLSVGVPPRLLLIVFGSPEWALWLTLAAALLFASVHPVTVTSEHVLRSMTTRRGAMHSVALAGTDVGDLAARATSHAVEHRWLRPAPVWTTAAAVGLAHSLLAQTSGDASGAVHVAAAAVALLPLAVLVTLFRAGSAQADPADRRVLARLRAGALVSACILVLGAAATLLLPDGVVAAVVLSQWPIGLLCGAAAALSTAPYGVNGGGAGEGREEVVPGLENR